MRYKKEVITIMVFLLLTLIFTQGIDVTDPGYSLTKQWQISENPEHYDMLAGSNFFGNIWLRLSSPNLFFARIGSALAYSSILWLVFSINEILFKKRHELITISSFLLLVSTATRVLTYNSIPAVFIVLGVYFIAKAMKENKNTLFIFSGASIALAAFSRLPFYLALILPLLTYFFRKHIQLEEKTAKELLKNFYLGAIPVATITLLIIWYNNGLPYYLGDMGRALGTLSNSSSTHSSSILIQSMAIGYTLAGISAILLLAYHAYLSKTKKLRTAILPILVIIVIFIIVRGEHIFSHAMYGHHNFMLVGIVLLASAITFKQKDKVLPILLIALFFQILQPLGSNTGIKMAHYSLFVTLPLSLIMLKKYSQKTKIFKVLPILMILTAVFITSTGIARDSHNRLELNHPMKTIPNIYTTKERAQAVDGLLTETEKLDLKGKTILCANGIPLIHYLTETNPLLSNPWPFLMQPEEFQQKLDHATPPEYIIKSDISMFERNWPKEKKEYNVERYIKNNQILEEYLKNYETVWSNQVFSIHKYSNKTL
ncbi:glycosyltransferase family 39 protein [archaeon]|nr:glycosyltransferase family 39 protein [archaeon]